MIRKFKCKKKDESIIHIDKSFFDFNHPWLPVIQRKDDNMCMTISLCDDIGLAPAGSSWMNLNVHTSHDQLSSEGCTEEPSKWKRE